MLRRGARAGIFDGLFAPTEDATELASGFRDTLAPKFDTGVLVLDGGGPRRVPARLGGADLGPVVACFVGIPAFEGVFARGGGGLDADAYSSSR